MEQSFPGLEIELVPGGRGDFIVTVDGQERWNKRQMDDAFPEEGAFVRALGGEQP